MVEIGKLHECANQDVALRDDLPSAASFHPGSPLLTTWIRRSYDTGLVAVDIPWQACCSDFPLFSDTLAQSTGGAKECHFRWPTQVQTRARMRWEIGFVAFYDDRLEGLRDQCAKYYFTNAKRSCLHRQFSKST